MQALTTAPLLLSPQVGRIGAPRMGGMQVLTTAPLLLSPQVGRIGAPRMGRAACKGSPRRPRASPHRWVALEVKKYLDKALEEKQGLRGTLLGLIAC
jgi:hypothetical protein